MEYDHLPEPELRLGEVPPYPPAVAKAISETKAKITKLEKDEKNPHANYKYAGIESFLEMVRPITAETGLNIDQDELHYEFRDSTDKFGKVLTWLVVTYAFTVGHSSGATWAHRPKRTAMVQASMGSQAFGAAQSYALKFFLRADLMIATGDTEDADSHAQAELPKKSAFRSRNEGDYPAFEEALRAAQSLEELQSLWADMQQTIRYWPKQWADHISEEKDRAKVRLATGGDEIPPEGGAENGGGSSELKALLKESIKAEKKKKQPGADA